MPTILINTNCLSNRKSIQSNSDQLHQDDSNTNSISNNDDFKQEINTIITKLLNKSESVRLFFHIEIFAFVPRYTWMIIRINFIFYLNDRWIPSL